VPNIAACDECYNAERNKLGVTEQSPCPEQISAGRAGANVCVNSCAPSQCSDAYIAFVLCIADSVSSCDYGTTAGNGGGTTNGINGSPERSSPSGVNSSDGGSSPSLGRHVISVASAVIVLLLIM
jgi:hypothetical protein